MQHPTNSSTDTKHTSSERVQRYNIDEINLSQSPIHTHPRHFQPGILFDSQTFERIRSNVYNSLKPSFSDDDGDDNDEQNLHDMLNQTRATELDYLSQIIQSDRPTDDNEIADFLLDLIGHVSETTTISTRACPPMNQTGTVADRDRPHADYGHLDRETLAQEFQFNLQQPSTSANQPSLRLHAKSFAITAWTNVSKELVMDAIKNEFGIENIQYICIGEEMSELNHQRHLHIQIIFKEKIDRRRPFLDEITETHCNYQVTKNDRAWNEYIRKGDDYIEFGSFQSTSARGQKQWPTTFSSLTSLSSADDNQSRRAAAAAITTAAMTTSAPAEQRRQLANQALDLAKISIHDAMDLIHHSMPEKFLAHSNWYLTTFKYIHLRTQQEADRRGEIDKEYVWPLSFPDCTPQLREAVNRWIRHHFSRAKRAKCLILIGPSGTGKTSFALSLPGRVNYFKGRWNLDQWNDYARYSVYDDIPWDEFHNLNYPNKKGLLTQNGRLNATDKYRGTKEITVRQPAIVLLNPEDAGSLLLLTDNLTVEQQHTAAYWEKRAFIYIMGPDEYFYRHTHRNNTNIDQQQSQASSNSTIASNDACMGELDEFDKMIQRYQEKHPK